jgi:AcrR family transcriptional regulator
MSSNPGAHPISGKARASKRKLDRRILRTRERLGDAMVELIREKPFDSITVQDVLDRAQVGRSTFYVHYRNKDDLFASDLDEFLDLMATMLVRRADASDRVAPVRELFAHAADELRLYTALVASGRIHDFLELGQEHFARAIGRRLAELPRARGLAAQQRATAAQALAGALLALLKWWIDRGMPGSPAHMDDLYHRMVWSGVDSLDGRPGAR